MIPQTIKNGIYPTMITPYTKDNRLDEDALRQLVGWYSQNGCHGSLPVQRTLLSDT